MCAKFRDLSPKTAWTLATGKIWDGMLEPAWLTEVGFYDRCSTIADQHFVKLKFNEFSKSTNAH